MSDFINQLKQLTKDWSFDKDVSKSQRLECQKIGRELSALGGFPLMSKAYYEATSQNPAASVIRVLWHGIGDWQM